MDDATWGIFQENWQDGFGADADHLKTTADIDACMAVGFTFYTIDPGAYVDNRAEACSLDDLNELVEKLPVGMQPKATGLLNKTLTIENLKLWYLTKRLYTKQSQNMDLPSGMSIPCTVIWLILPMDVRLKWKFRWMKLSSPPRMRNMPT